MRSSPRGVKPGDRVAVQVEKSAEAIVLYLACLRAGAVYLPLNTAYTLAELEYFIGDAEPRVVVCATREAGRPVPGRRKLGVAAVETLGTNGDGTLLDLAGAHPTNSPTCRARATISPRSSTPRAPPAARKARC